MASHLEKPIDQTRAIALLAALFFVFGFVTWLNATLIPFLKLACELTSFQALLVAFAFYVSYFVFALPAARILRWTGYQDGMALGLLVMAAGSLLFIPAAMTRAYVLFLCGLFTQGAGLCLLQTASNPYLVVIGPARSAARRIAIMGICNKVAGVISPLMLGAWVLADTGAIVDALGSASGPPRAAILDALAARVVLPYIAMAIALCLLAALLRRSNLPALDPPKGNDEHDGSLLRQHPRILLGFGAIFFCVAAEVIAGDTIALYAASLGVPLGVARFIPSATLSCMVLGYIAGILLIPGRLSQERALTISAALGIALAALIVLVPGRTSLGFVALLGLANAMMWPSIFPIALRGMGRQTQAAAAVLIMGIVGGALMPPAYALLARAIGEQSAYAILFPMYAYIAVYGATSARQEIGPLRSRKT